jgi:hypothetical protein
VSRSERGEGGGAREFERAAGFHGSIFQGRIEHLHPDTQRELRKQKVYPALANRSSSGTSRSNSSSSSSRSSGQEDASARGKGARGKEGWEDGKREGGGESGGGGGGGGEKDGGGEEAKEPQVV